MTCQELHSYYEDRPRLDGAPQSGPGDIAEHIASCAVCRLFVEERKKLGQGLRLMRESSGPVPPSLDASVLAAYRRHILNVKAEDALVSIPRFRPKRVLFWSAAALASAAVLLLVVRHSPTINPQVTQQTVSDPARKVAESTAGQPVTPVANPGVVKVSRKHPPRGLNRAQASAVRDESRAPAEFRSLMYCDELSCGGPMEMIRVQLPSAVVARPVSGFLQTSGPVTADVLVGADGIARGIRIEE